MKKYGWGIVYGLLLTLFTVYVLLDTFVIARVYSEVPQGKVETVDKGNPENREESVTVPEETKQQEESEKTEEPGEKEETETPEESEMQESPEPVWKTPVITENSYDDGLISTYEEIEPTITAFKKKYEGRILFNSSNTLLIEAISVGEACLSGVFAHGSCEEFLRKKCDPENVDHGGK